MPDVLEVSGQEALTKNSAHKRNISKMGKHSFQGEKRKKLRRFSDACPQGGKKTN
jgi:hypothetical protein